MERALICGWFDIQEKTGDIALVLEELKALAETAGAEVTGQFFQKRAKPDRRLLIGQGKADEIKLAAHAQGANLIIFYNILNHMQQRNLEDLFSIKVIDRTRLILDIFAQRARSMEGKLQVELAQMLYLLPRLTGKGTSLSRLGGGIGTRGPGETKLEADRRTIKKRISLIRDRLTQVMKNRDVQRKNRKAMPVPLVSLVGYTSAGKSTLFKTLTGEDVFISRKLFSTLDPLLRRVDLTAIGAGYYFLLSDTVGFIRSMPAELFTSFKATLEEVVQADIVLHVVDITNPDYLSQKREVEKILAQLEVPREKIITIFNKIDLLDQNRDLLEKEGNQEIFISAGEGLGIDRLKRTVFDRHFGDYQRFHLEIPEQQLSLESISHWAIVTGKNRTDDGLIQLEVLSPREKMAQFMEKISEDQSETTETDHHGIN